jgi:nitrogen PTS system EIIA component
MTLHVKDAARLLDVSEKTIYRWIRQGSIPAHRLDEQYRFNRAELIGWAATQRLSLSPEVFLHEASEAAGMPHLAEALSAGGVHYDVGGSDPEAVLRRIVGLLPLPVAIDRDSLFEALLARAGLGSADIGDGIAIPDVRHPVVLDVDRPLLTLCFLDRARDLGSGDGGAIGALFVLVSPSVRAHLHLVSRLGFVLCDLPFRKAVVRRDAPGVLVAAAERLERSLGATSRPLR